MEAPQSWHIKCFLLIGLLLYTCITKAATIQPDWNEFNLFGDIDIAVEEAIEMAHYAALRAASTQFRRKGTLMQDLLGAESEDDPEVLQQVIRNFNTIEATAKRDDTFIHCSDAHLTRIGTVNNDFTRFRDNSRGGASVLTQNGVPTAQNACAGRLRAFHYFAPDFGNVIILCSDSSKGAINYALQPGVDAHSRPVIGRWKDADLRVPAAIINPEDNQQRGLDVFAVYLSYMILHEFMHTSPQFPESPGGRPELYLWSAITGRPVKGSLADTVAIPPAAVARQANADSYALLACGWWVPFFGFKNGVCLFAKTGAPPDSLD